jgi:signal peptide peptidase SppA
MKFIKKIYNLFKKNKKKVAHLNLSGVIGKDSRFDKGLNFDSTLPLIEKAFKLDDAKAVAISINSPGGSPVQSELIFNAIREFSQEKKIPVYTFAQDVAASGGYWLLLSGDEIYAHNSSIIGSIGVIFSGFGFVDLIKKAGIERRIYAEGKNKAILDPFLPEENENVEILKKAQKDIFEGFKELVLKERKGKLKDENGTILNENDAFLHEKIFTGAFWSGKTAQKFGLIDEIADLRSKMKEKFGKDVEIVNIEVKKGFLRSIFSSKTGLASEIVSEIENKSWFSKFGL